MDRRKAILRIQRNALRVDYLRLVPFLRDQSFLPCPNVNLTSEHMQGLFSRNFPIDNVQDVRLRLWRGLGATEEMREYMINAILKNTNQCYDPRPGQPRQVVHSRSYYEEGRCSDCGLVMKPQVELEVTPLQIAQLEEASRD